jgi:hypothetical protein
MFGLSWWSVFDGLLALTSLAMTGIGIMGYRRANHKVDTLQTSVPTEREAAMQ